MQRLYESIVFSHLKRLPQMVFLAGPRQVGKTTIAQHILQQHPGLYLNWDIAKDRALILKGCDAIMQQHESPALGKPLPLTVLDEVHKFKDWKNYLKGFFDQYKAHTHIMVTGSSRLDVFVRGGDSLMGRYLPYTVYPLSVGELLRQDKPSELIAAPVEISEQLWLNLWAHGGFPDPFLQADQSFTNQWLQLRHQQLFREDILDLHQVSQLAQLEVLALLLESRSGQMVNYSGYAKEVRVSDQTIRRWFDILESAYYCFRMRPWFRNVSRSLRKEPKCFLWDWASIKDPGARAETLVACHLKKATQLWTQLGFGSFDVFFLRDKEKREVDFLVVRDDEPWFLAEVKLGKQKISQALQVFQDQLKTAHAFQVTFNEDFVAEDCFAVHTPVLVPAKTFLSQI